MLAKLDLPKEGGWHMDILKNISWDVRQLLSINERIQSAILRGRTLSHDEKQIVQHCATELLEVAQRLDGSPRYAEKKGAYPDGAADTCNS
jgi:hypothetical protein